MISCIPSDHHGLRLVFNNKNRTESLHTHGNGTTLLSDNLVMKEIKDFLEFNENEGTHWRQ